jgi:hypothetical protein
MSLHKQAISLIAHILRNESPTLLSMSHISCLALFLSLVCHSRARPSPILGKPLHDGGSLSRIFALEARSLLAALAGRSAEKESGEEEGTPSSPAEAEGVGTNGCLPIISDEGVAHLDEGGAGQEAMKVSYIISDN